MTVAGVFLARLHTFNSKLRILSLSFPSLIVLHNIQLARGVQVRMLSGSFPHLSAPCTVGTFNLPSVSRIHTIP